LQVIAGATLHNEGNVQYLPAGQAGSIPNEQCSTEEHYQYIAIAAPYLELIEEMTANRNAGVSFKIQTTDSFFEYNRDIKSCGT
jgi:hypothetical protein